MNGSDKCETCEADMAMIRAEKRVWVEVTTHVPRQVQNLGMAVHRGWTIAHVFYCDTCWEQQQARMFG